MTDVQSLLTPLWIMAAVSLFEALLLIGMGIAGYLMYARVTTLVNDLETRQIAPVRARVDAILADVQTVTSRVAHQTVRVDHAIADTIDRVDETAARMRAGVHDRVNQAAAVLRGIRAALAVLRRSESHA